MKLGPTDIKTPSHFFECPIWRYEEDDDLYHPVMESDDLPDSESDLSIRALFVTPAGKTIDGYVVGISRVFSLTLFWKERLFHVNKNLIPESREFMLEFISERDDPDLRTLDDIFPLRYTTQINRLDYRDFSGTFDLE